ncbi:MAG: metal ABC transporter substrate-binding protein, partial [Bacillota bacterium]
MFTKKFSFFILILLLLLVLTVSACQPASQEKSEHVVYTSIYPLYEVANRVSGDNLTVKLIVPNGAEVHSYRPTSRQIANLEDADLLFYNGLGLEPWAKQVTSNLKQTEVINVSEIVNLIQYSGHEEHEEHE